MRLRQLVLACGLASLALSSHVSALGLGEVKLKSTLNQPLQAEVKLLDTRDLTAEQILVTLASPADFERNGVDRLFFYTEFQFAVDLNAADGPKVLITSRNPVREPYLNFLIEARWTAGRLLREYTLLMDLPTFEENDAVSPVQSATTASKPVRQSTTTQVAPVNQPTRRTSSGSTGTNRQPFNGSEYEVRDSDTLWEIALRTRPDSSVSVHQSMMALYKANPEAFISGNINRLRRGQVLRVPDANEMKSLGRSEAVSQFATASGDSALGAQINASRRTSAAPSESSEVSGRVKLAAPSASGGSGQGSGANDGSGKALESELAATLEELDKSKAENTELGSRVKDLEAQIETMQRLVDVSNEKLRALQVAAEQKPADPVAQDPAPQNVEPSAPPVLPPVESQSNVTASAVEVSSVAESSVAASSESAVVSQPPVVQPNKAIRPPVRQPTLVDRAVENAPWIGLGVLGLAGAGYFVYRRRKQQAEEQQSFEQEDVFAMQEDTSDPIDSYEEVSNNLNEIDETSLFDEEQPASAVAETGDVVGEADIYIAYGKLDQAEEMLLNALNKDPNSTDIRMKLLEVYAQQQNVAGFDKQYAALLPLAGAALLARASELRAGISGAGEFESASAGTENASVDEFSLDDFKLDDDDLSIDESAAESGELTNFDFELDLDDDQPGDSTNAGVEDFSLDLDEDTKPSAADDLSELSLALDELDNEILPDDVESSAPQIEDEFNFDLDDDLSLDDDLALDDESASYDSTPATVERSNRISNENAADSLDVSADDFNLDMNVDDIDLAALDHEMESLDVDFDDALDTHSTNISEFTSQEIAKDQNDFELDLDDDMQLDDLAPSSLKLTDNLDADTADSAAEFGTSFALDDEMSGSLAEDQISGDDLSELDLELEELGSSDASLADLEAEFDASSLEDASGIDLDTDDEIPVAAAEADDVQDEDLFSEALSEFSADSDDLDLNEFNSDESALADMSDDEMDSELDFLADADEAATKLDLARAYIDMGDNEGAKDILSEVISEGNDDQRKEANELLGRIV